MSFMAAIVRMADDTPRDRNRAVDFLRAASILVVIFGHWLMGAVTVDDSGELVIGYVMALAPWTHPFTWIFQVMPVFFVVGGFANGLSWRSARQRDESYGTWLRGRLRRLTLPVMPLIVVWAVGGWMALRFGVDPAMLGVASQAALVPTWFLAAYVVIVTMVPVLLWLWDRLGWGSVALGIGAAGVCDLLSIGLEWEPVSYLNFVFVWGAVHQIGYAWIDGRLGGTTRRLALAVGGFAVTLALVWAGPYPVAMVGLDAAEVTNSLPPRVTLVFLGMFQAGLLLALEGPLRRWMHRPNPWRAVVALNTQIMTLYLWHVTALVVVLGLSMALGGFGLRAEPLTSTWWLMRLPWYGVLTIVTVGLAFIFGRFERPGEDHRPPPPTWRPLLAVLSICAGLGLLAAFGIADEDGLNVLALSLPILGVVLGGIGGARFHRSG